MFLRRKKNYWVSLEKDELVTPEETLLDSDSRYSDMERPIPASIFSFFNFVFLCSGLLVMTIVFKLSIIDHGVFAEIAMQNRSANLPLPAPRGIIFDRNGEVLVRNIPSYNILAISRELRENSESLDGYIDEMARIFNRDRSSVNNWVREKIVSDSTFFVFKDISKDQAIAIEYLRPKGFYVVPDTKREYINSTKLSQIIGYTGKVNKEDLADDYYYLTDSVGRLGIEAEYEKYIRGKHGNIFFSKGGSGYVTKKAVGGSSIALNIDYDIQVRLYDDVAEVLRTSGISRGIAVIQNPKTGEILALISFPSFDNNIFSSEVSEVDYKKLFESKSKPLFNRAIGGTYNPGSTIKPLIGMAALQEKIVDADDNIVNDCVSLVVPNPYNPSEPYVSKNWRVEYGLFNLKKSIANSCNIYFFTVGGGNGNIKGLGAEKIANYLKLSLADSLLGIDIPGETIGFVPTPDWKLRERGEPWYLGDTYNISIGQGDLSVTPIWLNSYISAIANGGTIFKPFIADKIIGENNRVIMDLDPEKIGTLPFNASAIADIREAMRETVLTGTAQILKELPVQVAAKTGTAEVIKGQTVNSFFTVFAPYNNPEIAMTILVEGATTQQGLAVRIAYNFLKWYFHRFDIPTLTPIPEIIQSASGSLSP